MAVRPTGSNGCSSGTRLAADRLRSARVRRESYVGPWLPEPMLTSPDVAENVVLADSVSWVRPLGTLLAAGALGLLAGFVAALVVNLAYHGL